MEQAVLEKKKKDIVKDVEIVLTIQLKQYRENQAEKCALEQIKQWVLDLELFILKKQNKTNFQMPLVILYLWQLGNVWHENLTLIFFFYMI